MIKLKFKTKKVQSDFSYLINKIASLPDKKVTGNLVETAERLRVFPAGSPFPGRQKYSKTPYMIEPAMELSPQSDTEEVVIMKCGQGGATAGATEPLILFGIASDPGPILAVTANDELAKTWAEDRLNPMFEQSGVSKLFKGTTDKKTANGGKGNTILKKSWPGGRLDIKTYGKISQIRQISYQRVILEEEEEAEAALKSRGAKQGRFKDVAYARTRAFRGRRKILRISTPLVLQTSAIYKAFMDGDQRHFYVPCPKCGFMQMLEWKHLRYSKDENNIVDVESVYYECQNPECHYHIKNEDKPEMLKGGEWRPHNAAKARPKTKSYHFNALYVPPGMDTWSDLAQQWVDAQGDPEKLQVFVNLNLGEPFNDISDAPPAETLLVLRSQSYKAGELPNRKEGAPIIAMMGCDVQQGNKRGGEWVPGKEARIEASLWGYGLYGRTWLIKHYVITGDTFDYRSGAFAKFRKMIISDEFPVTPQRIFIDSRFQRDEVFKFCDGSNNIYPIMGVERLKKGHFNIVEQTGYRCGNGAPLKMFELYTTPLKHRIYNRLLLRQDPATQLYPPGFMMFPSDMTMRYFEQLTAERPVAVMKSGRQVGWHFDAGGRSNEALDCAAYAWLALESFMQDASETYGEEAVNDRAFWDWALRKFGYQTNKEKL